MSFLPCDGLPSSVAPYKHVREPRISDGIRAGCSPDLWLGDGSRYHDARNDGDLATSDEAHFGVFEYALGARRGLRDRTREVTQILLARDRITLKIAVDELPSENAGERCNIMPVQSREPRVLNGHQGSRRARAARGLRKRRHGCQDGDGSKYDVVY